MSDHPAASRVADRSHWLPAMAAADEEADEKLTSLKNTRKPPSGRRIPLSIKVRRSAAVLRGMVCAVFSASL